MRNTTFKYITLELIEKIIRLKSYINKHSSNNRKNSNDAVIQIFEKAISSLLKNIEIIISDINDIKDETTNNELYSIQRKLSTCYSAIKDLHSELHILNTDWLKLETYTFVEQIYNEHINGNNNEKINVILSDDYTFVETNMDNRFKDIMHSFYGTQDSYKPEDSPTVIMPKIEYSNPLNWTILVHELGHVDSKNIKKLCENPLLYPKDISLNEKKLLSNWAEEIYCDIKAIDIIGPAYFLSLASYALNESLITGFGIYRKSHPPFAMRLALLHSYIDKNSQNLESKLPNGSKGSLHTFIYYMTSVINENIKQIKDLSGKEPSINDLNAYHQFLSEELIKEGKVNKDIGSILKLVENLKKKIPIGGYRSTVGDKSKLESLKKDIKDDVFCEIRDSLTDRKAELWEIINAGWVFKMSKNIPFGFKLFFDDDTKDIEEKLDGFSEKIELLDDRLLVSIETSKLIDIIEY